MKSKLDFSDLVGGVIIEIKGLQSGSDEIIFVLKDGRKLTMYHDQDCCENVAVEDFEGDILDMLNTPILKAEMSTNQNDPEEDAGDSFTWTFYKLATIKGSLDIRWYGTSNGYYSEEVYLKWEIPEFKYII
jgi:hypothetical protein